MSGARRGKVGFLTHNDKLYAVMLVTASHPCPRGRHAVSLVKTRHHDPRKKKKKKKITVNRAALL